MPTLPHLDVQKEMAQVPTYPSKIYFYNEIPAKTGGATPILRSDQLYRVMAERYPAFIADLEAKEVRYTRVLPAVDDPQSPIGRSWTSTFLTEDKQVANEKARELGVSLEWLPDGNVKSVSGVLPAVKAYPNDPKGTSVSYVCISLSTHTHTPVPFHPSPAFSHERRPTGESLLQFHDRRVYGLARRTQ